MTKRRTLLWVGDACVDSGFAKATHNILAALEPDYEIVVVGINYRGDPYPYKYPVYAAMAGGDWLGVARTIEIALKFRLGKR